MPRADQPNLILLADVKGWASLLRGGGRLLLALRSGFGRLQSDMQPHRKQQSANGADQRRAKPPRCSQRTISALICRLSRRGQVNPLLTVVLSMRLARWRIAFMESIAATLALFRQPRESHPQLIVATRQQERTAPTARLTIPVRWTARLLRKVNGCVCT